MVFKVFDIETEREFELNISILEKEDLITISTKLNKNDIKVSGEYHYEVLQNFRKELIKQKVDLKCYGALVNVSLSPMMMITDKAYFLELGKQAKFDAVVNIYDYFDVTESIHPEQQNLFKQKWIESL